MKLSDIRWLIRAQRRLVRGTSTVDTRKHANLLIAFMLEQDGALAKRAKTAAQWLEERSGVEMVFCDDCGRPWPSGCTSTYCERQICSRCLDEDYFYCDRCGELESTDNAHSIGGVSYCEGCYDSATGTCYGCEETFHRRDLSYDEDDREDFCSGCARGSSSDGRIHDYSTDVTEVFRGPWLSAPGEATDEHGNKRSKTPTLWMGFELEVVVRNPSERDLLGKPIKSQTNFKDRVTTMLASVGLRAILKNDGSIEGAGFEIVSLPGTLLYHQTQWGDGFFKPLVENCRGWAEKSCGMHVHLSRAALTHLQVGRLAAFITDERNTSFIEKVAGRASTGYSQIKEKKITDVKMPRRGHRTYAQGANGLSYGRGEEDRRQAVNLMKKGTVEIRIFQSNVSQVGFLKNLEFCDAAANFCRTASNEALTQERFLVWMHDRRGLYPNFTKWAVREGLMLLRHRPKPGSAELSTAA